MSARRGQQLIDWAWNREDCERCIAQVTGVEHWPKSACVYCPFALTTETGIERTIARYNTDHPSALQALVLEHRAVALNPRQGLAGGPRLYGLLAAAGHHELLGAFHAQIDQTPHALYRVRRIARARNDDPTRTANIARDLRTLTHGTRAQMNRLLNHIGRSLALPIENDDGIHRLWHQHRSTTLPAREHLLVAAPVGALDKGDTNFDQWWSATA